MGANTSATITRDIVNNVSNETVNLLNNISQTNQSGTDINQSVVIQIDGKLSCANLNITNDAKVTMRSLNMITSEQMAALTASIAQKLKAETKTAVGQENAKLNFLQSNLAVVVNEAVTNTVTTQESNITTQFNQTITQSSTIKQGINFIVGAGGEALISGDCNFTQTASVEYTAEQLASAAMQAVLDQQAVQEAAIQWDTAVTQKNTGIDVTMIVVIIIIIIVVVIAIALAAKYGGDAIKRKKAAKAAAA